MIKAAIFDMDGLLIDSEPVWYRAKVDFMNTFKRKWTWDDQTNTMGVSTQTWVNYIHKKIGESISKEDVLKGIIDRMKFYYSKGEIDLMPGAADALNLVKSKYKVGLASGSYKELLSIAVNTNNWDAIFEEILSSDDMERGKPFPDIYLEVINRLGVEPHETIVLEDSRDGIKAGVAAGAKVIAVPSKEVAVPQEVLNTAFIVIDSLIGLPKVINELD